MGGRLKDRIAVVSGSGQGIGRAIAIAMAREGAQVVTNNRRPGTPGGDAETTAREIRNLGGQAVPFFGDISKFETAHDFIQTAVQNFGHIDILVNNAAGADTHSMVWELTETEWDETISVHLKGSFNCIRHAAKIMKEQRWGRILNATSSTRLGTVESSHYASAMSGVVGLTYCVAKEMGGFGVTCNAYAPSARSRRTAGEDAKARYRRVYEAGIYTKEEYERRLNQPSPDTVAPLIVYLCTDDAADINGQVFTIARGSISIYQVPAKGKTIHKDEGLWTIEELIDMVPNILPQGYKNLAPAMSPQKE